MHSTTKYLSGHNQIIGGVVLTNDAAFQEKMRYQQRASREAAGPLIVELVAGIGYEAWLFDSEEPRPVESKWKNVQELMRWAHDEAGLGALPVLGSFVEPERWLLWLGVLFVLSVYHFPTGLVGKLRS